MRIYTCIWASCSRFSTSDREGWGICVYGIYYAYKYICVTGGTACRTVVSTPRCKLNESGKRNRRREEETSGENCWHDFPFAKFAYYDEQDILRAFVNWEKKDSRYNRIRAVRSLTLSVWYVPIFLLFV